MEAVNLCNLIWNMNNASLVYKASKHTCTFIIMETLDEFSDRGDVKRMPVHSLQRQRTMKICKRPVSNFSTDLESHSISALPIDQSAEDLTQKVANYFPYNKASIPLRHSKGETCFRAQLRHGPLISSLRNSTSFCTGKFVLVLINGPHSPRG